MNKHDIKRYEYNLRLLAEIELYLKKNPTQRFGQILWNLGILKWNDLEGYNTIEDIHSDEPWELLDIVKERLEQMKSA